jgi:hypothetical protein
MPLGQLSCCVQFYRDRGNQFIHQFSSKDGDFARCLHDGLQNNGVRCWFAPEDLKIGDKFRGRIDDVIRIHDKLLIILSENSIRSSWVGNALEIALNREVVWLYRFISHLVG